MSSFLGPIHHWLFKKIRVFEDLEQSLIDWGKTQGLELGSMMEENKQQFGHPTQDLPLEEQINTQNIHGWLQDKISKAELRHAYVITEILSDQGQQKVRESLKNHFYEHGNYYGKIGKKKACCITQHPSIGTE